MKFIIISILSVFTGMFCFTAYADWEWFVLPSGYTTESSLERAFQTARSHEKSVIVYYTRTRCPPCRALQSNLRREAIRKAYAPHYVFTVVWGNGMDSSKRKTFQDRYNVLGAPTWIIYNRYGDYLCTSHGGFRNPEAGLMLHRRLQNVIATSVPQTHQEPRNCASLSRSGLPSA